MKSLREVFDSPELYPVTLDSSRRVIHFVRMSPEAYRDSVFLDLRARPVEGNGYDIRLDDLLLAAASLPVSHRRVHYILNTGFCCSTLLARYFELLPSCFVLKEPRLLAQLVISDCQANIPWNATLNLCLRLMARVYQPDQMVVMKPVECCNVIGDLLLEQNEEATATFLMTPLRQFILALVKSGERRDWAQNRLAAVARYLEKCPELGKIDPGAMGVAEAAACLWLMHRHFCRELCSGPYRSRLTIVNGQTLADQPERALAPVAHLCGLTLRDDQWQEIVHHPSMRKYSKNQSRPYDGDTRKQEIAELERYWGEEVDAGIEWAERHGLDSRATVEPAWIV